MFLILGIAAALLVMLVFVLPLFVIASPERRRMLTAQKAVAQWDSGNIEVRLFQNDIAPTKATVVGDLTEATFTGYAAITTLAFADAVYDDDNDGLLVATETMTFTSTGSAITNTCYGYYLVDGNGNYLGAERFPVPQDFAVAGDSISFVPRIGYPNAGGAAIIS